ncbi:histone-like nucleoid-structuring protein Lsr2 [Ornithinimicrobium cryptoxanthini]|uniref:Lsr2 family protein n=1 Tax=Ornithinimicrobium cryptoxanthini TaxID=2934161 RepID=A0ABY4YJC3_9MICO|nr:Lsr2 family protein [Ornithinimicrobium cryptoxanthini]USQ76727.1 Lsr2 family protein [Ornithinimicrobium cryptoxanthini]
MAQRVQVILVDDLNGGEATETVEFALDGVTYELDLSDENATKLRDDFAQWIGVARRSGGRRQVRRGAGGSGASREELARIRDWGRANGFKVSDRGRVSRELQDAYAAAN